MNKIKIILMISVGIVIVILAASLFQEVRQRQALENLEISLVEIKVKEISLSGAVLGLRFSMYNPNDVTASLDRAEYSIWLNQNYLGNGEIFEKTDIAPLESELVSTEFDIGFVDAAQSVISALMSGEMKWIISGTAHYDSIIGTIDVPFEFRK